MRKRDNKGFTLVELVVTVVILVVLSALIIPSFSKYLSDKNFSEKVESEVDDVMRAAQVVFYELYANGSHGDTNDSVIPGINQNTPAYNNFNKYPTTYRIEANNASKDCDIHWNPLAAQILNLAGLDIKDNYPNIVLVCTGRYDIYANPDLDTYDPIKAYTVYCVGYQPIWGNSDSVFDKAVHYFLFKSIDGRSSRRRDDLIWKDTTSPVQPTGRVEKQSYMMINGEQIWVQYYLLKGGKNNGNKLDNNNVWKWVGLSNN